MARVINPEPNIPRSSVLITKALTVDAHRVFSSKAQLGIVLSVPNCLFASRTPGYLRRCLSTALECHLCLQIAVTHTLLSFMYSYTSARKRRRRGLWVEGTQDVVWQQAIKKEEHTFTSLSQNQGPTNHIFCVGAVLNYLLTNYLVPHFGWAGWVMNNLKAHLRSCHQGDICHQTSSTASRTPSSNSARRLPDWVPLGCRTHKVTIARESGSNLSSINPRTQCEAHPLADDFALLQPNKMLSVWQLRPKSLC